ncbi:MAG: glycosyltransferase family 2 protein [Bacteroidales bacterium]|jgi:glycosyltransferase involved in cell wall biosynthesis|nr:glycosyltransferase family 2 protein [Bacteroidales bacterium]
MFLSIIIPVFNEQDTIGIVLEKINELNFPDFVRKSEIVVVNDFSTDKSADIIDAYKGKIPLMHIKLEANSGKGAAVRTGFKNANGDVFLIQDADLELLPSDIPSMLTAMKKLDVEFINGSRYMAGISRPLSSYRRYLGNKFFTFLTSVLINVKLTDMACGYKLVKRSLIEKLKLKENRFGFEAEMIIKAMRVKKNNVAEVPVHYFPRNEGEGKKLKNSDGFKILWTITKYGLFRMK